MTTLNELRAGDEILIKATVATSQIGKSRQCILPSQNAIYIHTDADVMKVERSALRVRDRVKWFEDGEWNRGTILALEVDTEPSANGRVWAWVKDDVRWPRRTLDTKNLERINSIAQPVQDESYIEPEAGEHQVILDALNGVDDES